MKLNFPNASDPIVEGEKPMARSWLRWFGRLFSILGLDGSLIIWRDLWTDTNAMTRDRGLSTVTIATNITGIGFPAASDCAAQFAVRLPNDYVSGDDLGAFLEWAPDNTDTKNVRWVLEYSVASLGDVATAVGTKTKTVASDGVALALQRETFTDIDGASLVKGDVILIRISRKGADSADDYTGNAVLFGVGIKYSSEGIGEVEQHP
jgi:hypothetical protein